MKGRKEVRVEKFYEHRPRTQFLPRAGPPGCLDPGERHSRGGDLSTHIKSKHSLNGLAQGQPCLYITENLNFFPFRLLLQALGGPLAFFANDLVSPSITRHSFSTQNVNHTSYLSSNPCSISLCFLRMIIYCDFDIFI